MVGSAAVLKFTLYVLSIQFFLLVRECQPSKQTTDEFIEASKNRRLLDPLSCHVCHSETHSNCHNLTEDEDGTFGYPNRCDNNSTFCLVRKFSFTLTDENQTWPMKTFGIKRNCTTKCEPGCVIMGERTRLYVCNSCCQGDNCNVGSGSDRRYFTNLLWMSSWVWQFIGLLKWTPSFSKRFKKIALN